MGKVKAILTRIERHKGKILKFLIGITTLKFLISTFYRMYLTNTSRMDVETTINIYSIILIVLVCLHEFISCVVPNIITENFKIMTHYKGKSIIFILISFVYMSQDLGNQQQQSAFLIFSVGIILIFADYKLCSETEKSPFEIAMERKNNTHSLKSSVLEVNGYSDKEVSKEIETIESVEINSKRECNPYNIPEDF